MTSTVGAEIVKAWLAVNYADDPCSVLAQGYYAGAKADLIAHIERRIQTFRGSQVDETFLLDVLRRIGQIDIVIDDGSHRNEHVLQTFAFLFPRLSNPGMYVVEDTQTSYWSEMGGSSQDLERRDTSMGFFKKLIDGLNYVEFDRDDYEPSYYDKHIVAMHFYHSLVFIQKGMNNEGSSASRWRKR